MTTKLALLLLLQVRVVVLDPDLPREWVESVVYESENLHGNRFLPIRYRVDPLRGNLMSWNNKAERLSKLKRSKLHRFMRRRGGYAIHYVLPKTTEGYAGGVAYIGGDISLGYYSPTLRGDGFPYAVTTMTHEIGHNRGCSHVESQTLMNTGALAFNPRIWDAMSIRQMFR